MEKCRNNQAIVLASAEQNHKAWLEGNYFELRSKKKFLQETVGDRGTLWIVVSRPAKAGRLYTVSLQLNDCKKKDYHDNAKFGPYAVVGKTETSKFFSVADARLLLLALRFEPFRPINGPADSQVSNSLRVPRCLSESDITLLEHFAARSDRWSVFISYRRSVHLTLANELSDALQQAGVSVFRDQETLRGGDKWWPTIKRAISRSSRLIVLVGPDTHRSEWTRKEVQFALENNIRVIPVLAGGDFENWGALGRELSSRHALDFAGGVDSIVAGL